LELQTHKDHPPIVTNAATNACPCLWVYPYEEWCSYEKSIRKHAVVDLDAQAYVRFMVGGYNECPIDGQGRILLPPLLREYAQLERDVIITGVGERIEIWDKSRFEEDHSQTQNDFQRIAGVMARLQAGAGSGSEQ
jgi:MraZ protein